MFMQLGATSTSYFYPRPPRGGRPWGSNPLPRTKVISIHALREEGDLPVRSYGIFRRISIHALREEGDQNPFARLSRSRYFYPRPPRGGRLCA